MLAELTCLELFAGAGGLATGLRKAGIQHRALVEWNRHACQTLRQNYPHHQVHTLDLKSCDFRQFGTVDILAGGPPCQPFSIGGKHKGNDDSRNLFPSMMRAIASCCPRIFIIENVKGLLRSSFRPYFDYLLLGLAHPQAYRQSDEAWQDHYLRLQKIKSNSIRSGYQYNLHYQLLNAADYGIPQQRERIFIVGIRDDLMLNWSFPKPTHSQNALLWQQFISGEYWDRHHLSPPSLSSLSARLSQHVQKMQQQPSLFPPSSQPWRTIRDQIGGLPAPDLAGSFHPEHCLRPGAKVYPGHTGSWIDLPSKTLKAGDHGVPGGENMIRYHDGTVRYYTTYEAKLIQTFPADYLIGGAWTEAMRQLGNAVPVNLAHTLAQSLLKAFSSIQQYATV
jgi:DNA (cytosine-5)-methyltransferase 1